MANNLYEFYTGQGKKLPSVQERQSDATSAGIKNYSGTADQNNQLLKYFSSNQSAASPQPVNQNVASPAAQTYIQSQVNPPANQITSQAPTVGTPSVKDSYIEAMKAYATTQAKDQGITDARKAYNDYVANQAKSIAGLEGKGLGTPLQIVRGQQEKLLRQTQPEAQRLQGEVGIAQDSQRNLLESLKSGIDMNKNLLDLNHQELQDKKTLASEERLANPAFELSAGQNRYQYNPTTKGYEKIASMAPKPTVGKGTITSGSLSYSPRDQSEDSQVLEGSRGSDGYVDPAIYQKLYKAWIAKGGTVEDFTKHYDPQFYVNPANTWLPAFLRPKSKPTAGFTFESLGQ